MAKIGEVIVERQMRAGKLDEGLPSIFMRHRLAFSTPAPTDAEAMREACAKVVEAWLDPAKRIIAEVNGLSDHDIEIAQNVARGCSAAIRALPLPKAGEGEA
ncbi:hypothetical protein PX699_13225 [Sphingobium sp. H39-3-25]|uniref:hypothetical protein n=1 Tax=Sphingobium arseniciresistens TaxID=3030834 RepID=UPI0023B93143|nr:hypothetical protein [Sphingobium arseniciresistens]